MTTVRSAATKHPVWFVFAATLAWFALSLIVTGIASGALQRPYGDAVSGTVGRLTVTACVLFVLWQLDWPAAAGVSRLGRWQVWALALGGLLAFGSASLYAFYGQAGLDFATLMTAPDARMTIVTHVAVGLSEETLFRGLALYTLARAWGDSPRGRIGSVALTSALFAALHLTSVFAHGASLTAASLLTLETFVVSTWWATLVLVGGSIWPAVMLHAVVNAVVALQGLALPTVQPEVLAYSRVLWFSIPLEVLAIALLWRAAPARGLSEAPAR